MLPSVWNNIVTHTGTEMDMNSLLLPSHRYTPPSSPSFPPLSLPM